MIATHHQSRYATALRSDAFAVFEALAEKCMRLTMPELHTKFATVVWVASQRAQPRSFTIPEMAEVFGMTPWGMHRHLAGNPMLYVQVSGVRSIGSSVFLAPWLLDLVAPSYIEGTDELPAPETEPPAYQHMTAEEHQRMREQTEKSQS